MCWFYFAWFPHALYSNSHKDTVTGLKEAQRPKRRPKRRSKTPPLWRLGVQVAFSTSLEGDVLVLKALHWLTDYWLHCLLVIFAYLWVGLKCVRALKRFWSSSDVHTNFIASLNGFPNEFIWLHYGRFHNVWADFLHSLQTVTRTVMSHALTQFKSSAVPLFSLWWVRLQAQRWLKFCYI